MKIIKHYKFIISPKELYLICGRAPILMSYQNEYNEKILDILEKSVDYKSYSNFIRVDIPDDIFNDISHIYFADTSIQIKFDKLEKLQSFC